MAQQHRPGRPLQLPDRDPLRPGRRRLLGGLAGLLLCGPGIRRAAAAGLTDLADGGPVRAVEAIDGDTLRLADGRELRLVGVQAPRAPPWIVAPARWPLAEQAQAALAGLAEGELRLRFDGTRTDRYRRVLAHLERSDGLWVQRALLDRGLARVYSFADNRRLVPEMLAAEAAARGAGSGLWADRFYRVREPSEAARDIGSFQLVRGRVRDALRRSGILVLDLGPADAGAFTIAIGVEAMRLFRQQSVDPRSFKDRTVLARGWLGRRQGPSIEISHPEQITVEG